MTLITTKKKVDTRDWECREVCMTEKCLLCFRGPSGFNCESSLEMLSSFDLKKNVDKDMFLKCAWIVETEQCIPKALKLFKYYSENFADCHDSTQEFNRCLAQIRCVPAELEGNPMTLNRFADTTAPKEKHFVFKVVPIIPEL